MLVIGNIRPLRTGCTTSLYSTPAPARHPSSPVCSTPASLPKSHPPTVPHGVPCHSPPSTHPHPHLHSYPHPHLSYLPIPLPPPTRQAWNRAANVRLLRISWQSVLPTAHPPGGRSPGGTAPPGLHRARHRSRRQTCLGWQRLVGTARGKDRSNMGSVPQRASEIPGGPGSPAKRQLLSCPENLASVSVLQLGAPTLRI